MGRAGLRKRIGSNLPSRHKTSVRSAPEGTTRYTAICAKIILPMPAKRLPIRRLLASAFALAMTIHTASAGIRFDLRASGPGTTNGGKSVSISSGIVVQLELWAQVTNAAPTFNIFGVQTVLGAIVSTGATGFTGTIAPMTFPPVFGAAAVVGVNNEISVPADVRALHRRRRRNKRSALLQLQLHSHSPIAGERGGALGRDEQALRCDCRVRKNGGLHCLRALTRQRFERRRVRLQAFE